MESTFGLNLPKPILEPERFSVNDEARNFPKEAVDRGLASQEPSRKRRQTDETQIDGEILAHSSSWIGNHKIGKTALSYGFK